jgi:hypothetical protein
MATKAELLEEAEAWGLDVGEANTKAEIQHALDAAKEAGANEEPEPPPPSEPDPEVIVEEAPHAAALALAKDREMQKALAVPPKEGDGRNFAGRYTTVCCIVPSGKGTVIPPRTKVRLNDEDARRFLLQGAVEPVL